MTGFSQHNSIADVTLVTDPRFMGGTASAFLSDVDAFARAGVRVGIRFIQSNGFFKADDPMNPALLALGSRANIEIDPVRTRAMFIHNPQVFGRIQTKQLGAGTFGTCERVFVVAHHPPFLGDGALCYDPIGTNRAIQRLVQNKVTTEWLPVSGLVRAQLRSFQPFIALGAQDWVNTFDTKKWVPHRDKLTSETLTVGRHGRANPDKWPNTDTEIAASLPSDGRTQIHVLGADSKFFTDQHVNIGDWKIDQFGALEPTEFLDQLDVFSYFFSDQWVEAFGRTIAEAMLMGVRCILDHRLKQTFGEHAIYCEPQDVQHVLNDMRRDLAGHRAAADVAQTWARDQFDQSMTAPRLKALLSTQAKRRGVEPRMASPTTTVRKLLGFHRRTRTTEAIA